MTPSLNPQERLDWLRLIRSDNVGPITFYQLLQRYGSAAGALAALPELAERGGRRNFKVWPRAEAEREMAAVARAEARLVAWGEAEYPPLLAELDDAPPLITLRGRTDLAGRRAIGIVGARNASAAGQRFAREIAWDLGRHGFVVVSGLARGIDAAAHGGALESGTIGVVAGGADVVYPEENRRLHEEIAERGVILAEMPVGTVPQARHFPRRNRLVSGLCVGVLVVEAALKSGSLITARFAAEQGRDVFAVPGSPLDPRCRGANDLIRNGATLVESVEDMLGVIGPAATRAGLAEDRRRFASAPISSESELSAARDRITELLGPTAVTVDELIRECHFSPSIVAAILLELELAGRLDRHPGGRVSRR
ncbi:MAG TPA: DNA-processing protein DprA [Aliidongia sp.]|nr:DNA-processing protein DprA [Aliidongia sp.]